MVRNRAAFVFSHPNHELAVFGLVQEFDPWIVYLTDGGGWDRVAQTREGLGRIGSTEKAIFLNYPEDAFYQGLLDRNIDLFQEVAEKVGQALADADFDDVGADALEFYNPVHDLAGPITRAALAGRQGIRHLEIPLVREPRGRPDVSLIQRLPSSAETGQIEYRLSPSQLDAKVLARDEVYTLLGEQFGSVLRDLPLERMSLEVLGEGPALGWREPDSDYGLRYERRASILLAEGKIKERITFRDHFLPVVEALLHC